MHDILTFRSIISYYAEGRIKIKKERNELDVVLVASSVSDKVELCYKLANNGFVPY